MFGELKLIEQATAESYVNDDSVIFERKYDGTAGIVNVNLEYHDLSIWGRGILKDGTQQEYTTTFPDLLAPIDRMCCNINDFSPSGFKDIALLGEIVVLDDCGDESFKGIESRCNRKNDIEAYAKALPATFMAFDILHFNGVDLRSQPFIARRAMLAGILQNNKNNPRIKLIDQAVGKQAKRELLNRALAGEIEGIVVKDLNTTYPQGIYKFKYKETQDVFWEGEYKPGNGRHTGRVGALICYQYIVDRKVKVASVGGGMTDALRDEITTMVKNGEVTAEKPRVLEVQTHELLPSGAMRYPNFVRWRTDKSASQCVRKLKTKQKPIIEPVKTATLDDWL